MILNSFARAYVAAWCMSDTTTRRGDVNRPSCLLLWSWLLLLLVVVDSTSASSLHSHSSLASKCHLIPDQIVFSNFNPTESSDNSAGGKSVPRVVHRRHQSSSKNASPGSRLKIYPHYHQSFFKLPDDILKLYRDNLIPDAISYWESSLRVKYPYSPIFLGRLCSTSQYYFSETTKSVSCDTSCATETKCGDFITIPEEHLDVCRSCRRGGLDCTEYGSKHKGIDADFILYISSISTEHCNISNTVAFASYCQLESKHNRPVAGYVNICPQSVSSKQSDIHSALATLKHEILHALGFSAGLYAFFLDDSGTPLTPRDAKSGKPPFNHQTNMYEPSERVLRVVPRGKWRVMDGYVSRNVTMIVTPRVVNEVRRHFDCPSLEGAELEDQGEIGTKLTHWEKRVFENEAMTGTYTQNSVFSRITFAFLEDTGWYVANYSNAEELSWGKGLGCDFVKKSCMEWIEDRQKNRLSIRPFCNIIPNLGSESGHSDNQHHHHHNPSKYECNEKRDAVLLCNMMKYNHQIPRGYRNHLLLSKLGGINKTTSSYAAIHDLATHLGGSVVLADYCPFMQQVSWSINSEIRDSKCLFEENKPDKSKNYILEEYGKHSRCFLHNRSWQIYTDKCQSRITVSKTIGCYTYECDPDEGLLIKINDNYVKCSYKDEVIEFTTHYRTSSTKNSNVYFGNIICPACEELCHDQIKCPGGSNVTILTSSSAASSDHNLLVVLNRKSPPIGGKSSTVHQQRSHSDQHSYCLKQTGSARLRSSARSLQTLSHLVIPLTILACLNFYL